MPAVRDLSLGAERSLLKLEGNIFAKICSPLRARALSPPAATKNIAKAEELAENVVEVLKDAGIETGARAARTDSSVAKAVVQAALFRIGEHGISFAGFLEPFFCAGIIRIAVRMVLHRQLAIGALDLLVAGPALHPQHFVIVSLHLASQDSLLIDYRSGFLATRTIAGRSSRSFSLISALQLFQHMMIFRVRGLNHFYRFVKTRVKLLILGRNRFHAELCQRILQLLVDQLYSYMKFRFLRRRPQRPLEAVEHRNDCLHCIHQRVVAEILLLFSGAFAGVVELRLHARLPVEQCITLGAELFYFSGSVRLRLDYIGSPPLPAARVRRLFAALLLALGFFRCVWS